MIADYNQLAIEFLDGQKQGLLKIDLLESSPGSDTLTYSVTSEMTYPNDVCNEKMLKMKSILDSIKARQPDILGDFSLRRKPFPQDDKRRSYMVVTIRAKKGEGVTFETNSLGKYTNTVLRPPLMVNPNAIATPKGWADPKTGELLMAVGKVDGN